MSKKELETWLDSLIEPIEKLPNAVRSMDGSATECFQNWHSGADRGLITETPLSNGVLPFRMPDDICWNYTWLHFKFSITRTIAEENKRKVESAFHIFLTK